MKRSRILDSNEKNKNKTTKELLEERNKILAKEINDLRKKWYPEKYNPNLDEV